MDQLVLSKLKQEMQKLADETKVYVVYNDYKPEYNRTCMSMTHTSDTFPRLILG